MAPTLDASTPATVHATGTSGTSAAFSPPASSLLSVMIAADGPVTSAETVTVSDSGGHTWTMQKRQNTNASGANAIGGTCEVWDLYFPAAPGSITVTASWSPTSGANGGNIVPRVYIGANPDQSTAATAGTSSNGSNTINPTIALTPTQIDSIVVGAALDYTTNATLTPNGSTTDVDQFNDATNGDTWAVWQSASPTTSLGAVTYGYTNAAAAYQLVAVEILPAPGGAPPATLPPPLLFQIIAGYLQQQTSTAGSDVTAIQLTETGSADDSSIVVTAAAALSDTGSGSDALTVSAAVPLADAGTGSDAFAVTAAVPLAETASGSDVQAVTAVVPLGETGAGSDTASVTATVPLNDASTGAESVGITAAAALGETATGADAISVTITGGPVQITLADAGTAAEKLCICKTQLRPNTGTTARPATGTTIRPAAGTTARPNTGTVTRPNTGTIDPCCT